MNDLYYEVETLTGNDLEWTPDRFKVDGNQRMFHHWNWVMFFVEGDDVPHYYCRSILTDEFSSGNVIRMGEGPFGVQTGEHHDDMAQKDYGKIEYKKINDDPITFEIRTENPYCCLTYSADKMHWQEGDFLDFYATPLKASIFTHPQSELGVCYNDNFVYVEGTYEGKPAKGMGCYDREYSLDGVIPYGSLDTTRLDEMFYVMACMAGVREDGRMECLYSSIKHHDGNGVAFYWLEGEEIVMCNKPRLEADWQIPPYIKDPDDRTVSFSKATWYIGDKEIHVDGKWGTKGHTFAPRLQAVGFDNGAYGPWYVGKTPYKHKAYLTFQEFVGATAETIRKSGWEVKE